jgi:hypothetical protein
MLRAKLDNEPLFQQWFGCHVTQPKYPELIVQIDRGSAKRVGKELKLADLVRHNPSSRFAYMINSDIVSTSGGSGETQSPAAANACPVTLFVDGNAAEFEASDAQYIRRLCDPRPIEKHELKSMLLIKSMKELFEQLVIQGSLVIE